MQKIYVLQCENGKYYVGKTFDVDRRFAEHLSGENGSEWTSRHRPLEMIKVKDLTSDFDEMNTTLEYVRKYGIDNVRGAQWSNVNLTQDQRAAIMAAINTEACFSCGDRGHYSNNCPNRDRPFRTQQTMRCFNCGEYGHFAKECTRVSNRPQRTREMPRMQCARCGRDSHLDDNCYATFDIHGDMLGCARCGRDSHGINECYAKSHVNGERLCR